MSTPTVLCLRTAGTNCDRELAFAFEMAGARVDRVHLRRLFERPSLLQEHRILAIPGGFTYGDDLGAGRILALEMRERLGERVREFVAAGGFVLGICNGFQVLVHTRMLPGTAQASVSLVQNESHRFECRWVHLRVESSRCVFLRPGTLLPVPVAHAEGRFITADAAGLRALHAGSHVALRYVDERGEPTPPYPADPNGSMDGIAGITDSTGRILGMMPHPERNIFPYQHPCWTRMPGRTRGEGLALFEDLVSAARSA